MLLQTFSAGHCKAVIQYNTKWGVANVSLASIRPTYKRGTAWILLMCHTPFIIDYSCTSKCLLVSTHSVALERYHICTETLQVSEGIQVLL